ncbi:MAG: hypothetical protein ACYC54_14195 [Sedimentisphaerales bacterium]
MFDGGGRDSRFIMLFFCVCFCFVCFVQASVPEGFSLLADRSDVVVAEQNNPSLQMNASSAWLPYAEDCQRGFTAYVVDTSMDPNPNWLWTDNYLTRELTPFACRGQYKTVAVAIRTLAPVQGLNATCGSLTNGSATIASENVDIRWIQYTHVQLSNPAVWEGKWLEKATTRDFPAVWTVWMWVTFYIPDTASQGTYKGHVTISDANGNSLLMPVKLLVLDFDIVRPAFSYGMYLPGHPYSQPDIGDYVNYAAETFWEAENLQQYLRYWKSRGLNSPGLYHVHPELLKCIDGHTVIDLSFVSAMAQAMNAVGMTGDLYIDTRWISWWSRPVADEIQRRINLGLPIAGDIGIDGWQGYEGIMSYNDTCKRLYREGIEQIIETSQNENWPHILFNAEDEPTGSWDNPSKAYCYDTFTPVLCAIDPNIALIIDNGIGYPGAPWTEIDRGDRDNLKFREYNSWTDEALAAARADNAEVRGYNLGFTRSAVGQYGQRINSTGYHQWADQWRGESAPDWMYARITASGIVGSIQMDRIREGIDDRAYYYTLEQLITQLDAAGQTQEAANARSTLESVVSGVPLRHFDYIAWSGTMTSTELDRRLWNVVKAIAHARTVLGLSTQTYSQLPKGAQIVQRQGIINADMFTDILHDDMQNAVTNRGYFGCTMVNDGDGFIKLLADTGDATMSTNYSGITVAAKDVFIYQFQANSLPVAGAYISVALCIDGAWYHSNQETKYTDLNYHTMQFEVPASGNLSAVQFDIKWAAGANVSVYDYRIIRPLSCSGAPDEPVIGDLNNDFKVDFKDYALFANKWLEPTATFITNTCDSLSQFDNYNSMTLSINSGGPWGNYLTAVPKFVNATVAWKPNGSSGMSVSAGDQFTFNAKGYATDFMVTVYINGAYYTLRAYNTTALSSSWTAFQYSMPVSGTFVRAEFSVWSPSERCSLDNIRIAHAVVSNCDLNNDTWIEVADLAIFAEHWLECVHTDCQ